MFSLSAKRTYSWGSNKVTTFWFLVQRDGLDTPGRCPPGFSPRQKGNLQHIEDNPSSPEFGEWEKVAIIIYMPAVIDLFETRTGRGCRCMTFGKSPVESLSDMASPRIMSLYDVKEPKQVLSSMFKQTDQAHIHVMSLHWLAYRGKMEHPEYALIQNVHSYWEVRLRI